jgi:ribosomal protein L37AE/L43A
MPPVNTPHRKGMYDDYHQTLKPYIFHGVELSWRAGQVESVGDCPFCKREGKFRINTESGLWKCLVCGTGSAKGGGNLSTFLRVLWEMSYEATRDYTELAQARKFVYPESPMLWGAAKSLITGEWLLPGYNSSGAITQLYRWVPDREGKYRAYGTAGLNQALYRPLQFNENAGTVYFVEGFWDAVALYEVMRYSRVEENGELRLTGNVANSLLEDATVMATPGCDTFRDDWAKNMAGKRVILMYDNDHPRVNGTRTFMAGRDGMRRVSGVLASMEEPPESVNYLQWGPDGYDPKLPHGHDIRDTLGVAGPKIEARIIALEELLKRVKPVPADWIPGRGASTVKAGGTRVRSLKCTEWEALQNSWRRAMKWTEGLDRALSVMLASVASTNLPGDQLWIKIIGPASCGKSTLAEALAINQTHVVAKSVIRGFHSGFQVDRAGKEDSSLLAQLKDKTLVTKDGDTLLQSPNLGQILAEARDIYDRTSRTHYRNKMGRDYIDIDMTWILLGTNSLKLIDQSELGERFLDCVIMEGVRDDLEDEILDRVAAKVLSNLTAGRDTRSSSGISPTELEARQLTGGYIDFLRGSAPTLLQQVTIPDSSLWWCKRLAKFVAHMRARPSKKQAEIVEREFASRLLGQLMRLGLCLAVVLNKKEVDREVMRRVQQTAVDTSRGVVLSIAHQLYEAGDKGHEVKPLSLIVNQTEEEVRKNLRFLRDIGATLPFQVKTGGYLGKPRWKLTEGMTTLYSDVIVNGLPETIPDR